jgi:hypothetical protein
MFNMTYSKLTNFAQTRSKLRRTLVIVSVERHQNFHWTAYLNARNVCVCVCVCVDFYETTHTSNNPKKNRKVKVSCSWGPRWYFLIQHWTRVLQASSKTPSSNWSRRCISMFTIIPDTLLWVFHVLAPVDMGLIRTDNTSIWCIHCDCYTNENFSY